MSKHLHRDTWGRGLFAHAYYVVYTSARSVLCTVLTTMWRYLEGVQEPPTKKPRQSDEDTVCDDV